MKKAENTLKKTPKPPKKGYTAWIFKNVISILVAIGAIYYVFDVAKGYNWTYYNLLRKNVQFITKNPKLNFDQKMIYKFGASYEYIMHLKMRTPKDAVILYPGPEAFTKEGSPFQSKDIINKRSAIRFLYPRKLILESELDKSAYSDKITHIAIANGIGFDKVPYEVEEKFDHGILPVQPLENQ